LWLSVRIHLEGIPVLPEVGIVLSDRNPEAPYSQVLNRADVEVASAPSIGVVEPPISPLAHRHSSSRSSIFVDDVGRDLAILEALDGGGDPAALGWSGEGASIARVVATAPRDAARCSAGGFKT